jgi:hypothetical protein
MAEGFRYLVALRPKWNHQILVGNVVKSSMCFLIDPGSVITAVCDW